MMRQENFFAFSKSIHKEVDALLNSFLEERILAAKKIHPLAVELFQEIKRSIGGGKRNRPTLVVIGYLAGGGKSIRSILPAATAIEIFHLYALIHDDIMDHAETRRFEPTTIAFLKKRLRGEHIGLSAAILAGDLARTAADNLFLRCKVNDKLLRRGLETYALLKEEVELGQYLDIRLQQAKKITAKDLAAILTYKTAKYSFERPLHIGAALAGASTRIIQALSRYALPLGIAFQIRDDILGVFGKEKDIGKSADSDIREGKSTLLKIEALKKADRKEKEILLKTLGNIKATPSNVATVRKIFRTTGAYNKVKKRALMFIDRAQKSLSHAPLPSHAIKLLTEMANIIFAKFFISD